MNTTHLAYLRVVWNGWWVILAFVLISTGLGLAYSYSQIPRYEAKATFVVNPSVTTITSTFDLMYSLDTLAGRSSLATTYANVLESRVIVEEAVKLLGLSADSIAGYNINAVVLPDSSVLMLTVQGPSPNLSADLANAIGAAGLEYISGLQEIYELRRLDLAVIQFDPISPNHQVNLAMSAIIGLASGVVFVFLRYLLAQFLGDQQSLSSVPIPEESITDRPESNSVQHAKGQKPPLQTDLSPSQSD